MIEIELRVESGEKPTHEQYLARYPDWAPAIAVAFANGAVASALARTSFALIRARAADPPVSTDLGPGGTVGTDGPTITAGPAPAALLTPRGCTRYRSGSAATG